MTKAPAYADDVGRRAGEPTDTRTFRLPVAVIARAQAQADKERRSLNNLVLIALEAYLDEADKEAPK